MVFLYQIERYKGIYGVKNDYFFTTPINIKNTNTIRKLHNLKPRAGRSKMRAGIGVNGGDVYKINKSRKI
jgi:hypothetical protein